MWGILQLGSPSTHFSGNRVNQDLSCGMGLSGQSNSLSYRLMFLTLAEFEGYKFRGWTRERTSPFAASPRWTTSSCALFTFAQLCRDLQRNMQASPGIGTEILAVPIETSGRSHGREYGAKTN